MELQPWIVPLAALALGLLLGFFAGHSGRGLLLSHIAQLNREIEGKEKRHDSVVRSFLHRLDVHPDDEGKCRVIDRSKRTIAKIIQKAKAARLHNEREWAQVNQEAGVPVTTEETADDGNG